MSEETLNYSSVRHSKRRKLCDFPPDGEEHIINKGDLYLWQGFSFCLPCAKKFGLIAPTTEEESHQVTHIVPEGVRR